MKKIWDHAIELKERFILQKEKMRPSKLFQIVPVLFIEKIIVRNI